MLSGENFKVCARVKGEFPSQGGVFLKRAQGVFVDQSKRTDDPGAQGKGQGTRAEFAVTSIWGEQVGEGGVDHW